MDFDLAKENIQPLRQGRRADRLELALSEQSKESLENEKRQYEEAINNYEGVDPLSVWYEYICWIEQSYPKGGSESGLDDVVLRCILHFEDEPKYKQDRRMIKLFIKYIDSQQNPHECYNQLYNNGIGTMVADLYIAWSYYFDALNNYKEVEAIFRKGIDAGAQPLDELAQAHQAFGISMSRRMLYDDETSQQQFQASMAEKRSALTSLRTHKKKFVGSIRTGIAIKDENPGVVNQENAGLVSAKSKFEVLKTDEEQAVKLMPANTSVIRSIVDSARKNENVHEPGPWNKAKIGKHGSLFGKAGASNQLDFAIMEDDNLPPIPCPEKLFEKGVQLPKDFVSRNKPQLPWEFPIFIQEPLVPRVIPCYEKFLLYPNIHTEISPDEYRGYKWFKDRNMTTTLTEQYDKVWMNTFDTAIRLPPGFQICNVEQVEKEEFEQFALGDESKNIQLPLHRIYPEGDKEELSLEELLAEKFKAGKIELLTEDDFVENMDLTLIGDRRQSFYPASFLPRKSIIPRKSIWPSPTVEEEPEEETLKQEIPNTEVKSLGAIRKSTIKRKSNDNDDMAPNAENMRPLHKKEFHCDTPPRFNCDVFKPPAPVEKKAAYPFNMDDDEPNESCSTMQFNFFLKAQSVSTPVSKKNVPKLTPLQTLPSASNSAPDNSPQQNENDVRTEPSMSSNQNSVSAPISTTQPQENYIPKQLSTIMETTESTQSTKSSVGNETEFNVKTPKNIQNSQHTVTKQEIDNRLINPLIASFRLGEEQTETFPKMPVRIILQDNVSQLLPMKVAEAFPFQIFEDDSLPLPPGPDLGTSLKNHGSSNSSKQTEVTQIEIPETQNVESEQSCLVIPLVIPANKEFEDDIEIPATQDFEAPETDDIIIPAAQKFPKENSIIQESESMREHSQRQSKKVVTKQDCIPSKHDFVGLETPDVETISSEPATGSNLTIYTISSESPVVGLVEKQPRTDFCIYEDSVREDIQPKQTAKPSKINEIASDSLHMSRKENFFFSGPVVRTPSEEFLAMCSSPESKSKKNATVVKERQNEISDLLKFSNCTASGGTLESSLKRLSLEPVMETKKVESVINFLDDDLNTEKFTLPLGASSNSTLVQKHPSPTNSWINEFDISISFDSDEMERLGSVKAVPVRTEFKVPELPVFKAPATKPLFKPVEKSKNFNEFEYSEDGRSDDLSLSIYVPKPRVEQKLMDDEEFENEMHCSFQMNSSNQYEHTITENSLSNIVEKTIQMSNGNPFDERIRKAMLDHCEFSQYLENNVSNCTLLKKIPQLKPHTTIQCKDNEFTVMKFICKGGFGSIFTAKCAQDGEVYAMKQEKPSNLWEFYISLELLDRLKDKRMIPAFLNIEYAIIAHNSSIFVTQFSPYGTIIDVCNKHKNVTNKNVDEYIVMVLTTQLLSIIDHLHACKIIHADIKPDNFLMMSKIEYGMKVPALQLIDFGRAIDMDWYSPSDAFTHVVKTDHFTCCEMLENKPWTYQTDLFGLAGTSHVMLFGKYMQVEKKILTWNITSRFPRYFNRSLWEHFFNTLLNVQSCSVMPNLQALKDEFEDFIQSKQKFVVEKISEFNKNVSDN